MVNLISLSCRRFVKPELFRNKNTASPVRRNVSDKKILIPPRKNRGPLDILQALARTVQIEKGVTEYRFQYGGIFDVNKSYFKRLAAMSMDSGRKAAKWVVAQHPHLFQHRNAEPYIKAFAPPKVINEQTPISEEILLSVIEDVKVEEAIKLYKLMKEKNIDVSMATKQQLLEMVCYFNCQNKPDDSLIETKYCENPERVDVNTWQKMGFAEELFAEMEENSESYAALILGRFKYKSANKAIKIYDEAKEKGIEFGVEVYNALLAHAALKSFEHTDQEAYIIELLNEMKEKKIEPNLDTLNSTLMSVAAMKKWSKARNLALKVYHEFKDLGITPSLATYYYLIDIFSDRNRLPPAFIEILDETENKTFSARHPDDFKFFTKAMDVASYDFKSIALAQRVHDLLLTGSNKWFLNNSIDNIHYYRSYITVAFRYGDLDEAVNLLETFVPQAYNPETVGVLIIITSLNEKSGAHYLPRIWPLLQEVALKSERAHSGLASLLVEGMIMHKDSAFMEIAEELWRNCSNIITIVRNSHILTSFLKVFVLGEAKALSDEVFMKAVAFGVEYVELDFESLNLYTELCISKDDKKMALACLEYAVTVRHKQVNSLVENIKSKFSLEKEEEKFIEQLLKTYKVKDFRKEGSTD